tara:strand:- start:30 stop:251 length:222 start_codon:yes stop_codon:yes gene_type:complete
MVGLEGFAELADGLLAIFLTIIIIAIIGVFVFSSTKKRFPHGDEIKKINDMLTTGLITQDEYSERRKKIIAGR